MMVSFSNHRHPPAGYPKVDADQSVTLNARQMLAAEIGHIRGIPNLEPGTVYDKALRLELSALCLSGGGIRSAAFCLGVLQALAGKELLRKFDYLSTVSGGGFIGAWLQQIIREACANLQPEQQARKTAEARVAMAEQILASHEPRPLDQLRDNTNYLAPKTGPASADTWAGIALYIRNLTLNWIVFAPVFLLAALAPIFHRTTIWWLGTSIAHSTTWTMILLLGEMLVLGYGVFLICHWLPTHRSPDQRVGNENKARYLHTIRVIAASALAWAMLVPISLQSLLLAGATQPWAQARLTIPGLLFVTLWLSYEIAARWPSRHDEAKSLFKANRTHWVFAAVGSAAILALLLHLLLTAQQWLVEHDGAAELLTLAAPIVLVGVLLAHSTFYLGLRVEALYGALDREWLARLNGIILGVGAAWTLFAASCIIPSLLTLPQAQINSVRIGIAALVAMGSGFAASWLGKQVITTVQSLMGNPSIKQQLVRLALAVLPMVFIVALFALLAALLQLGLGKIRWYVPTWIATPPPPPNIEVDWGTAPPSPLNTVDWVPPALQIALGLVLAWLIWKLGRIVNVNRFSMHAVYRNRLIRAFLGTPRSARTPDPFTGFDDADDVRLKDLKAPGQGQRLFPVINMTLNITTGGRDAWAERKGSSFTATPLHCGAAELRLRTQEDIPVRPGVYVPTENFAGKESDEDRKGETEGTHLGSMLTVSGAAASPNWGYHSSPAVAFLMTLFNVRLGAWYPNPARATSDELRVAKPRNSLAAFMNELLGRTTDENQAVYLSDGGHFENLGVYEMLRRRCTRILVVDAGQDPGCKFFDLGMMIRKSEIDLPVKISITTSHIASRKMIEEGHAEKAYGFAYGTISYVDRRGNEIGRGGIIYIKTSLLADAPAAVHAFAADNDDFPHESTDDQFYSESQFESYRCLGEYQARKLTDLLPKVAPCQPQGDSLQALFDEVAKFLAVPRPLVVETGCCV